MDRNLKIIFLGSIITILIASIFIVSIFSSSPIEEGDEQIVVAATLMPQKEFIERVGKEKVNVVIMVPDGADPHTYEIEPSTMQQISKAQLYFKLGSGMEFEINYMDRLKSINPQMKLVNSSREIDLIHFQDEEDSCSSLHDCQHHPGDVDSHVWTSPGNVKSMVEIIYEELIIADPENKEFYHNNKEEYLSELDKLDQKIKEEVSNQENKQILVYHPAWGYFCQDYGLEQIAIEKDGKEPTPQTMANIIQQAKKEDIKIIFVSPQFPVENAKSIAQEIGAEVVLLDPLSPHYLGNMEKVLEAFSNA